MATPTVVASESSSEPGWTKAESARAASRVAPAKSVVRPAVARARIGGLIGVASVCQLLPEAGDDQQRVVDAEGEAHHRADDEGDRVDGHEGAEQDEDAAAGEDGEGAEGERDRGGDQRAEDDQQDDEEERHGEQLGALGGVDRFVLQAAGDGGEARLGGGERRADLFLDQAFEGGNRLAHRRGEGDVVVDDDQRLVGARAAARRPCPGPRGR